MKGKIKVLLVLIIGMIIGSGSIVLATALIPSSEVTYDDTNTQMGVSNVQDALEELYNLGNQVEYGSLTITFPYKNWQFSTIYFENEFTDIPEVFIRYNAGSSGGSAFINGITKTYFQIGYNSWYESGRSDTVEWIAIND